MSNMLIVDAQVHIWESGTPVPIHRQVSSYTKDELLRDMDEAGVDRAVLHPPSWDPRANEVAIEAARAHPDRLAVLGFFDISRSENRSLIDRWRAQPGMLGLRFAFLALAMTVAVVAGVHPVGLVIGLSTIVPAVVIAAFGQKPVPGVAALPAPPPDDPSWDDWNAWTARERVRDTEDEDR